MVLCRLILSEYLSNRQPLVVYKTSAGNHARERINQMQIDIIKEDIIPKEIPDSTDLGIVTPYRNQTSVLQQAFKGTSIKADTVDKFQGRENKVIILSTQEMFGCCLATINESKPAEPPMSARDLTFEKSNFSAKAIKPLI